MILRLDGTERTGPALDARGPDVDPGVLLDALRDPDDDRLECPPPGPVHGHLDRIAPTTTLPHPTTALAAAARSRGATTTFDTAIDAVGNELDELETPSVDVTRAVRAVSEAASQVEAHRDRVARLGGIVAAQDEDSEHATAGADAQTDAGARARTDAKTALRTAAAELAEAETTHHAVRQELARERERQRAANDARERRLRLQDRLENLRRDARRALVAREHTRMRVALDAIPEWPWATMDARCTLALVRNSARRAPVIVVDGPFRTPVQARACLAAPVVLA